MADGMALAALSMINDMNQLSMISRNVTNGVSGGYKGEMGTHQAFSTLLVNNGRGGANVPVPGLATVTDMREGALRTTGNKLDVAIRGAGFFEVSDKTGTYYTRQGNFTLDAEGRLVTPSGEVVSGVSGDMRLSSPFPKIDQQGNVYEEDRHVGQIKVVGVDDARLMVRAGSSRFTLGQANIVAGTGSVLQGYTEASNVNTATEMVKLIQTTRHFESGQKVIQFYDEMADQAISKLGAF